MIKRRSAYKLFAFILILSLTLSCNFLTGLVGNSVNAKVTLDETHASSAVISPDGGMLTAQGADGTKYTLTFPKDALSTDETITLTPITVMDGLLFSGGLVGGVQMAPEGLRLFQAAILTIESPKTVATIGFETVVFGYHQNGEGLYLTTSEAKGNLLTIEVWHFSGEGAAQGTPAEIQAQQQRVPSNAEDAFTQRMQDFIGREKQTQMLDNKTDPEFDKKMGEFLREGYNSFIAPQLPIALQNCEAAPAILSKALSWKQQVDLLKFDDQFQSEIAAIQETVNQAIVNCYNKEYDQCVIDKKIEHRTTMLGYLRQATFFKIEDQLDQTKIEKCPPTKGYKASGQVGSGTWEGVVCSLDQPFTINALPPDLVMPFKFTPNGSGAGTISLDVIAADVRWTGSGTYDVQGSGAENPSIVGHVNETWVAPKGAGNLSYDILITLTPLTTNECGQP